MKKTITLVLFLVLTAVGFSQTLTIKGKVTDANGQSIPGVTVLVMETSTGTVTDLNGNYEIKTDGKTLKFSFVGYIPQTETINGRTTINTVLQEDLKLLNEVVVIGYGTIKKKDLTTAVAVVDEKEIKDRPITNAVQALQGKAAGVQVVQISGKPGAELSVRVRGATSVIAGNDPLYVVDGVMMSDIKSINPNDVTTISILKDASASAIYGSQGGNGVVLITTKRGNPEAPSVQFSTYFGVSNLRKPIDVLNTKQYRDLMEEVAPGSMDPTATNFNNWSDIVFGTGYKQSYQLSTSGGTEKSKYYISAGYMSDEGIVNPAHYDRINMKVNLDNQINPWFNLSTNINLVNSTTKDTPDNLSSGRGGVIMSALNTPPFLNIYKEDGSGQYDPNPFQPSWENPVAYMYGPDQKSIDRQVIGNFSAELTPIKNIKFKSNMSVDIATHQWDYYLDPFRTNYGRQQHGIGYSDKGNYSNWNWENTANYTYTISNHHFNGIIGSSLRKFVGNQSYLTGSNFPADTLVTSLWAANTISGGSSEWSNANASFFGRMAYDLKNRYYLTLSARRDGSSKLSNKWGWFPSFSVAWRISSEEFMKNLRFIDDLKIRGGWGKVGNEGGLPNYSQSGLFSFYRITQDPTKPLSGPGSYLATYGNPDLKWETTTQSGIGFDLSMLGGKLSFVFDVYYKKTTDVLMQVQLASSYDPNTILTNAGEIENKGLEFNISSVNIDNTIRWTTDYNMSFNKNKVVKLTYTPVYYFGRIYSNNQDVVLVKEGIALGSFYGYISEGVDPETGNIIYKDFNKNGIFDPGDRTIIGDANPDFTFGLTNNVTYKRFDLNVFIQGSYGNDIFNATRIDLEGMFDSKNQSVAVLDRWTPENTITDIPRAGVGVINVRNSSRFVEDGSYARLKSLTLSYRLLDKGSKFKGISKLSVYVTGQNLITLTNYSGFDPEVNSFGKSATEMGIDYGTYPQSRALIFGINVDF